MAYLKIKKKPRVEIYRHLYSALFISQFKPVLFKTTITSASPRKARTQKKNLKFTFGCFFHNQCVYRAQNLLQLNMLYQRLIPNQKNTKTQPLSLVFYKIRRLLSFQVVILLRMPRNCTKTQPLFCSFNLLSGEGYSLFLVERKDCHLDTERRQGRY